MADTPVTYPIFEISGHPCETPGCKGVLVDHVSWKPTCEFFRRCTVCRAEFHRVPAAEKLAWAKRVIARVTKGEKTD